MVFILWRRCFVDRGIVVRRNATLSLNIPIIKNSPPSVSLSKYLHYILHFSRCNITLVRYVGYSSEALCESRFAFIIPDPRLWLCCTIPRCYCNLPRGVQSRFEQHLGINFLSSHFKTSCADCTTRAYRCVEKKAHVQLHQKSRCPVSLQDCFFLSPTDACKYRRLLYLFTPCSVTFRLVKSWATSCVSRGFRNLFR